MNLLFAKAEDWMSLVIPGLVLMFWVFNKVLQQLAEGVGKPGDRQQRRAPVQQRQDPQKELERFLEDLGVKRAEAPKPPPAPAQPKRQPQVRKPENRRPAPTDAKPVAVHDRHLKSAIESRHQETIHSQLENTRLASQVESRRVGELTPLASAELSAAAAPALVTQKRDAILMRLLGSRKEISRAFILGQVLGAPRGVDEWR